LHRQTNKQKRTPPKKPEQKKKAKKYSPTLLWEEKSGYYTSKCRLKGKYKEYYLHCSIITPLLKNKGGLKNQLILLLIKTVVFWFYVTS
jgi:hypothetical protein